MLGDAKLEFEGKADQAAGKVQNAVGGLKDTLGGNNRSARISGSVRGGGYYGHSRYGGTGLGGVLGRVLVIAIVVWLVGGLGIG